MKNKGNSLSIERKGQESNHYKPMSGRVLPRFSGIKTFFRLPHEPNIKKKFDVALWGVPYDGGNTYRPGARFAPQSVREVSSLGRSFHWENDVDVFSSLKVADIGDAKTVPLDLIRTYEMIQEQSEKILKTNKKLISIGGDHSITLPLLRAFRKRYGQPLSLVHFDAHLDTYPAAWGCEYHHGTFIRHALEEGLIDASSSFQIGLRGPLAAKEDLEINKKWNLKYFTVKDIKSQELNTWIKKSLPKHGKKNYSYISFDIDVIDPAFAPGTGTPVVGGLTSYEALQILMSLQVSNLVGADLVEIAPPYDSSQITSLLGVSVLFELVRLCGPSNSKFHSK